jgi:hypothetical protein
MSVSKTNSTRNGNCWSGMRLDVINTGALLISVNSVS